MTSSCRHFKVQTKLSVLSHVLYAYDSDYLLNDIDYNQIVPHM